MNIEKKSFFKTKVYVLNILGFVLLLVVVISKNSFVSIAAGCLFLVLSYAPWLLKCEICKSSGYRAGWISAKCSVCGTKRYGFFDGILVSLSNLFKK